MRCFKRGEITVDDKKVRHNSLYKMLFVIKMERWPNFLSAFHILLYTFFLII